LSKSTCSTSPRSIRYAFASGVVRLAVWVNHDHSLTPIQVSVSLDVPEFQVPYSSDESVAFFQRPANSDWLRRLVQSPPLPLPLPLSRRYAVL